MTARQAVLIRAVVTATYLILSVKLNQTNTLIYLKRNHHLRPRKVKKFHQS